MRFEEKTFLEISLPYRILVLSIRSIIHLNLNKCLELQTKRNFLPKSNYILNHTQKNQKNLYIFYSKIC